MPSRPQSAGVSGTAGLGRGEGGYAGASSLSLLHMLTGLTPDATPRPGQSEAGRYVLNLLHWPVIV